MLRNILALILRLSLFVTIFLLPLFTITSQPRCPRQTPDRGFTLGGILIAGKAIFIQDPVQSQQPHRGGFDVAGNVNQMSPSILDNPYTKSYSDPMHVILYDTLSLPRLPLLAFWYTGSLLGPFSSANLYVIPRIKGKAIAHCWNAVQYLNERILRQANE